MTGPTGSGYLTVFPAGASPNDPVTTPNVSTINFTAGQTIPNLTFAIPGEEVLPAVAVMKRPRPSPQRRTQVVPTDGGW